MDENRINEKLTDSLSTVVEDHNVNENETIQELENEEEILDHESEDNVEENYAEDDEYNLDDDDDNYKDIRYNQYEGKICDEEYEGEDIFFEDKINAFEDLEEEFSTEVVQGIQLEEEIEEELEEEDRQECLEIYMKLLEEKRNLRRKNTFLHRKVTEHIRKKHLDKMLQEPMGKAQKYQKNYDEALKNLANKIKSIQQQKNELTAEIEKLQLQGSGHKKKLEEALENLVKWERNLSAGLINSKTGKPIPKEIIDRFIARQREKVKIKGEVRLQCIRIANKVAATEQKLRKVESIGGEHRLMDFEQLRMEHFNYTDKLEERQDELNHLRLKDETSVQILTHLREKSYAVAVNIQKLEQKLKSNDSEMNGTRKHLNKLKIQHDKIRSEDRELREESGLMTQPKLLRDYIEASGYVKKLRIELAKIKKLYEEEKNELVALRKQLEEVDTQSQMDTVSVDLSHLMQREKLYRRPTMIEMPINETRRQSSIFTIRSVVSIRK